MARLVMTDEIDRREALKRIGAVGVSIRASTALTELGTKAPIVVAGQPAEIRIATLSASTVRITVLPLGEDSARVPFTGALADENAGELRVRATDAAQLTSCLLYTSPSPRDRQKSRMPS